MGGMVSRDDMLRLNKRIRDNEKLIADAILAETKLAAHPVGSIYKSTDSTSPAVLFGGVWEAYGGGRVLVGYRASDEDFDAAGKYGGHKAMQQHTHTQNAHAHTQFRWADNSRLGLAGPGPNTGIALQWEIATQNPDDFKTASATATNQNAGTGDSGNMPPYITVYRWRRTA